MKKVSIERASRTLAQYTAELEDEIVVVTKRNRPVAALVPLRGKGKHSLALSTHPEFLALVRRSRAEVAIGKTRSLSQVRAQIVPRAGRRRDT